MKPEIPKSLSIKKSALQEGMRISVKTDIVESVRGHYLGEDCICGIDVIVINLLDEPVLDRVYIPIDKITAIGVYK
jgi:hypothetical protein